VIIFMTDELFSFPSTLLNSRKSSLLGSSRREFKVP